MSRRILITTLLLLAPLAAPAAERPAWPWGDELDAVIAAPESHLVMLENERVRVLDVRIRPGEREPAHTHRWPSVMLVVEPARIRYYDRDGELVFETPERSGPDTTEGSGSETHELAPNWLRPEGLHAVENIDERRFRAIRIELKEPPGSRRPPVQ